MVAEKRLWVIPSGALPPCEINLEVTDKMQRLEQSLAATQNRCVLLEGLLRELIRMMTMHPD